METSQKLKNDFHNQLLHLLTYVHELGKLFTLPGSLQHDLYLLALTQEPMSG